MISIDIKSQYDVKRSLSSSCRLIEHGGYLLLLIMGLDVMLNIKSDEKSPDSAEESLKLMYYFSQIVQVIHIFTIVLCIKKLMILTVLLTGSDLYFVSFFKIFFKTNF